MRQYILLVLLLLTTVFSRAQSENNNLYKNNNTNNKETPKQLGDTLLQAPVLEEMRIEQKSSKSYKKKEEAPSKSPRYNESDGKEDSDSNASIQQLKNAKYQFESNYSSSKHQLTRRSPSNQELLSMKQSAQLYANLLPGSFEKHFYAYLLNKYDSKQFSELEQAAKLNPEKTEVQQELVAYGVAVDDQNLADSVTVQMINQNKIPAGLLVYATDLVNSVPANGTLLLHGYTELIPVNYQMNSLNRGDVELISVDLMQSSEYQANLTAKGYVMPNSSFVDTTFVQNFCALNTSKNIYLSMSFPKEYFQGMASSLNTAGLTFAYDQASFDYTTWNTSLVESKWKKRELGISTDQQSDALSANYLPALISIEQIYREYNKTEQAKEINHIIISVATRARKTGQLSKIKR